MTPKKKRQNDDFEFENPDFKFDELDDEEPFVFDDYGENN
jgi:hypothetical protein